MPEEPTTFTGQPDPTPLTTQQILREISNLEKLLISRIQGMELAQAQFQETITRVPTELDKRVTALRELLQETFRTTTAGLDSIKDVTDQRFQASGAVMDERFASIQLQFKERDTRVDSSARDSKLAVDAALQAAKEAVGKSEIATFKQIDQLGDLLRTRTDGLSGQIGDIKERLTGIEQRTQGISAATVEARHVKDSGVGNMGMLAAVVFGAITVAGLIIGFIMRAQGI